MSELDTAAWRALYSAAADFRELRPWRWMDGGDIFAIKAPGATETAYCTVIGVDEEQCGMLAFFGAAGFDALWRAVNGDLDPGDHLDVISPARSLAATFVERDMLENKEREFIKSLGLKFRGNDDWPFLRSTLPGYWPWNLEQDEAELLRTLLVETMAVAKEVREGKLRLAEALDNGMVLTRQPGGTRSATTLEGMPRTPKAEPPGPLDTAEIEAKAASMERSRVIWEAGAFYLPVPLQLRDGERPYVPACLLVVAQDGSFAKAKVFDGRPSMDASQDGFASICLEADVLPRAIHVSREEARMFALATADALQVKLKLRETPFLDEARQTLQERFLDGSGAELEEFEYERAASWLAP